MNKPALTIQGNFAVDRSFEILIESTFKSLKKDGYFTVAKEAEHLLSKRELVALIKNFQPEDTIELLLVLQHIIGFLWTTEKLFKNHNFEPFANLSLRASDLLIRYKAIKKKKASKKDIPHETLSEP